MRKIYPKILTYEEKVNSFSNQVTCMNLEFKNRTFLISKKLYQKLIEYGFYDYIHFHVRVTNEKNNPLYSELQL